MCNEDIRSKLPFLIALAMGLTIHHRNGNKVKGRADLIVSDYFRPGEWTFDNDFKQHIETVLAFLEDSAKLIK